MARFAHLRLLRETAAISNDELDRQANEIATESLTEPLRAVLAQLAKARDYARDLRCDPWEFAVEIEGLLGLGATISDLRWLAKKAYVEHAVDVTRPDDANRRFRQSHNLAFTRKSCFLLADAATGFATPSATTFTLPPKSRPTGAADDFAGADAAVPVANPQLPRWDSEDRTLYVGDVVVKEYRVLSPNQEAVLSAFQEEGWPHYIDDPLSPVGDQSPKQRLHNTIRRLNENQKNRLIRFRGDGTGERVRWELLALMR